jgi:hypothetical protein
LVMVSPHGFSAKFKPEVPVSRLVLAVMRLFSPRNSPYWLSCLTIGASAAGDHAGARHKPTLFSALEELTA